MTYGRHSLHSNFGRTLHQAFYGAALLLDGQQWVRGPAGTIVKRRIREITRGIYRSNRSKAIADRKINNFVARMRALEARR